MFMISLDFLNKPYGMRLNSGDCTHRRHWAMSGDFWDGHMGAGRLLPASIGKREANHPPMHRTNPHNKKLSDPNAASAQVDKPSLEMISIFKKGN